MMSWRRIIWLALCHAIEQNGRAVASGIGGLLFLAAWIILAFALGDRP